MILKKILQKKKTQKKLKKKSCEEKLYQSIVFFEEKLVITILNQLNI
jgi:predicted oxidoreductase (fatty acid repression mutant protein)